MPWKETDVLEERLRFIAAWQTRSWSMADLCRCYGISRKTGYKYLARFKELGLDGLKDQIRAPRDHPNQTSPEVEGLVLEARQRHSNWGSKKLLAWLSRHYPDVSWPVRSTIGEILKRHGLTRPQTRTRRCTTSRTPFYDVTHANATWCADFKGWFRTRDGKRCDPLTISDAFSRYALACRVLPLTVHAHVKPVFEQTFKEHGLPGAIRTDNGPPFATTGVAGLSKLSVWWIKLGIRPERIQPGKPSQNGRHERFHRTLKQETVSPPKATLRAQQLAFTRFLKEYNRDRPHEALDDRTPADLYQSSPRPFPTRVADMEYPDHFEVRGVRKDGRARWRGELLYVTQALSGERVGLEQITDRHWTLCYGPLELGVVDASTNKLIAHENLTFTRRQSEWRP